MSYFINDGTRQLGPFTIDQLKEKGLLNTTPVWREGLSEWVQASSLPELQFAIAQSPPIFYGQRSTSLFRPTDVQATQKPSFNFGKLLGQILMFTILALLGMFIYFRLSHPTFHANPVFNIPIIDPEHANPSQFLIANGTYRPNFWRTKEEISGTITNSAAHTNYKDVHIRLVFYSQTKSVISSQEYIIYEYVPYGSTQAFSLTVDKPAAAATCGWTAIAATYY